MRRFPALTCRAPTRFHQETLLEEEQPLWQVFLIKEGRDNDLLGSKYIFTNKQNYTKRLFQETGILQAVT